MKTALALVLLAATPIAAHAQTETPVPAATATPAPVATATASPIVTPEATPIATPEATPSATPEATATPVPMATPIATPSPAPTVVPKPPPPNPDAWYRESATGKPGTRPLRAFAAAGIHAFYGEGWDEDPAAPDEEPPKSADYVGGGLRAGAIWEWSANLAAVGQVGGHQGRHALGDEDADPEPVSIAYGLYYAAVGGRWQRRPAAMGFYLEAGAGFAMGRVIVTRPDATDDAAEHESFPTFMGYGAAGVSVNVGRGVDLFLEGRYMTAPHGADSFTSDHELDLGGVTATAGVSLRL